MSQSDRREDQELQDLQAEMDADEQEIALLKLGLANPEMTPDEYSDERNSQLEGGEEAEKEN
jgi:hypothetical protein